MPTAITAVLPNPRSVKDLAERERIETIAHCYDGSHIPVALIFFGKHELVVDFAQFNEEKRWIVASRLSEHMPIYQGLSTRRIYAAGMEHKLKIGIKNVTFLTLDPIPLDVLTQAIA